LWHILEPKIQKLLEYPVDTFNGAILSTSRLFSQLRNDISNAQTVKPDVVAAVNALD
jgi:hypothetical protein